MAKGTWYSCWNKHDPVQKLYYGKGHSPRCPICKAVMTYGKYYASKKGKK